MGIENRLWGMHIIIFKVLIAPTIFVIGLKQYAFKIQQSYKQ
jgi:hypothetical protein